jgi:hypothetical protein
MILPTKYEKLKENSLIVGSHIITFLKDNDLSLNELHHLLQSRKKLELDLVTLIDTLSFLYLTEIIEIDSQNLIRLTDETKQNLHIAEKII